MSFVILKQHEMQKSPLPTFSTHTGRRTDAPKEPEFKPFDRVLVRDDDDDEWHIDFFEGMNKDKDEPYTYQCINSLASLHPLRRKRTPSWNKGGREMTIREIVTDLLDNSPETVFFPVGSG